MHMSAGASELATSKIVELALLLETKRVACMQCFLCDVHMSAGGSELAASKMVEDKVVEQISRDLHSGDVALQTSAAYHVRCGAHRHLHFFLCYLMLEGRYKSYCNTTSYFLAATTPTDD